VDAAVQRLPERLGFGAGPEDEGTRLNAGSETVEAPADKACAECDETAQAGAEGDFRWRGPLAQQQILADISQERAVKRACEQAPRHHLDGTPGFEVVTVKRDQLEQQETARQEHGVHEVEGRLAGPDEKKPARQHKDEAKEQGLNCRKDETQPVKVVAQKSTSMTRPLHSLFALRAMSSPYIIHLKSKSEFLFHEYKCCGYVK
jgi:hypothetical protein